MELADRVRLRRLQLGLTQDELAKKMGYSSRASINKIENGRPITQKIIVRLAKALNVTPAYLMGWEDIEFQEIVVDELSILKSDIIKKLNKCNENQLQDINKFITNFVFKK